MAVPYGFCCANVLMTQFKNIQVPPAHQWRLQFFTGPNTPLPPLTPITTLVPPGILFNSLDGVLNAGIVQSKINAPGVIIIPGVTITVDSLTGAGLSLTVCFPSSVQITDFLDVQFFDLVA